MGTTTPNRCLSTILAGICIFAAALPAARVVAEEKGFLIENWVFVGNNKQAVSRSTTIFVEGQAFDYLKDPAEVIVMDKARDRFVLLDKAHKVRCELSTEQVTEYTQKIQQTASQSKDPFVKFLAAPTFRKQYIKATDEVTLSSKYMTYRIKLRVPAQAGISKRYREFSDWYAQLNSILNPNARPPMARWRANSAMAGHQAIAREVHLSLSPKGRNSSETIRIRSTHQLYVRLTPVDLKRVADARRSMSDYRLVRLGEYRRLSE